MDVRESWKSIKQKKEGNILDVRESWKSIKQKTIRSKEGNIYLMKVT
jgi:hypothetical protein